jgi:cell division septation protein DedD
MRAERLADYDDRMDESEPRRPRRWGRFLLLFVLAVVLVAGGAWGWLLHGKRVTAMFAKSSNDGVPIVRADTTPFKSRPRDPGGMDVPDRDKLVYERLQGKEGETRVERLLPPAEKPIAPPRDAGPAPQVTERLPRVPTEAQVRAARPPAPPSIMLAPTTAPSREPTQALREPEPEDSPPTAEETAPPITPAASSPAPSASPPPRPSAPSPTQVAAAPPASGYLIQIAAVREEDRAAAEWARLQRQHPDALQGLKLFVIKADLGDKGVFWRLRAGPFADEAQAKNRCADLAKRKVGCLVVKAEG